MLTVPAGLEAGLGGGSALWVLSWRFSRWTHPQTATAAAKQYGGTKASSVGNIPRGSILGPLLHSFISSDLGSVRFCHCWCFLKSWGPWPVMSPSFLYTHKCPEFFQVQKRSEKRPSPLSSQDHRQQCSLSEEQGSFLKSLLRFNSHDIHKLLKGRN